MLWAMRAVTPQALYSTEAVWMNSVEVVRRRKLVRTTRDWEKLWT